MKVRIPREIGPIARICSSIPCRFPFQGVRVEKKDGAVTVTASDGKRIIDVKLKSHTQRESGPDGVVIVPVKAFKRAAGAPRITDFGIQATKNGKIQLTSVDDDENTFVVKTAAIKDAYPAKDEVFPKEEPAAVISVNPKLLGEVLLALDAMKADEYATVKMSVFAKGERGPYVALEMNTNQAQMRSVVMGLRITEPQ